MDANKIRRLERAVGSCHDHVVWVVQWLEHLNMFSEAQIYDIINFVKASTLADLAIATLPSQAVRVFNVVVCDSRWVAFSGGGKFWDTATAEEIDQMPQPAVTHITCDCMALLERKKHGQKRSCSTLTVDNQTG